MEGEQRRRHRPAQQTSLRKGKNNQHCPSHSSPEHHATGIHNTPHRNTQGSPPQNSNSGTPGAKDSSSLHQDRGSQAQQETNTTVRNTIGIAQQQTAPAPERNMKQAQDSNEKKGEGRGKGHLTRTTAAPQGAHHTQHTAARGKTTQSKPRQQGKARHSTAPHGKDQRSATRHEQTEAAKHTTRLQQLSAPRHHAPPTRARRHTTVQYSTGQQTSCGRTRHSTTRDRIQRKKQHSATPHVTARHPRGSTSQHSSTHKAKQPTQQTTAQHQERQSGGG